MSGRVAERVDVGKTRGSAGTGGEGKGAFALAWRIGLFCWDPAAQP